MTGMVWPVSSDKWKVPLKIKRTFVQLTLAHSSLILNLKWKDICEQGISQHRI